jgi:hypothetical protein
MCALFAGQALAADVYQGTVKFKNSAGKPVTATLTVTLDRTMPEADRLATAEQVKSTRIPQKASSRVNRNLESSKLRIEEIEKRVRPDLRNDLGQSFGRGQR